MDDGFNPYELLKLESTFESSATDIKKAYRRLALLKHPDKNPDANPEEFLAIQRAYDVLCDKAAKEALDNLLRARASREARLSAQSLKRRKMREELEHKERACQAQAASENQLRSKLKMELDRLRAKLNSQAEASQASSRDIFRAKKVQDFKKSLCIVKLAWGPECVLEEKDIRALFAAVGNIKFVAIKKMKRKGSGALLEMGSQEEAEAVVRHVEVHEGLGLNNFTAKLTVDQNNPKIVEQDGSELDCGTASKFIDSKKPTADLQSLEEKILGKLKRKAAVQGGS